MKIYHNIKIIFEYIRCYNSYINLILENLLITYFLTIKSRESFKHSHMVLSGCRTIRSFTILS